MPRVLRIFNRLILGGPAFNVTYLTRFMAPEFETQLLIGAKEDHEEEATFLKEEYQLNPLEIPSMKRSIDFRQDYQAYQKIREVIRTFKPHIVHTHAAKPGALGRLAAAHEKVPVIVHTFHGHVFHSYFGALKTRFFIEAERYLAKKSHRIIAISDLQKKELSEDFSICAPDKISVVPLGIDLDRFYEDPSAKRNAFREKYGISKNAIALGMIGRIVPVKNHLLFVEAIAKVLEQTSREVRIIIVGDGDQRPAVMDALRAKNISFNYFPEDPEPKQVTFTSWLTRMDEVYAGIDVVALSSLNEGTPVSLIEAQASGKAIVSTDVGGVRDVVIPEVSARVVPSQDVGAFADALLNCCENDSLRAIMSASGRNYVRERYDKMRLVQDMRKIYSQLLHEQQVVL